MKSTLTKTEFKQRLTDLTSRENSSFRFSRKPFAGTFSNSTFDLVRNSFWPHVKVIKIKGEYVSIGHNATEVFYEVGVSKQFQFLALLLSGATFVGINMILIASTANLSAIFAFSGFSIFVGFLCYAQNRMSTKIVNRRFQREFEIETGSNQKPDPDE